jgi:class 3 adenylate cyclase
MMRLARELPPEDFGALLEEYQGLVREVLERTGGRAVEVADDTITAVFATALGAALAAAAAQRALAAHEWPHGLKPEMSLALHSGDGAALRCSELCDAAEGGEIFMSEATARLLEDVDLGELSVRDLGERQTRRTQRTVRAYELVVPSSGD